MNHSTTLDAAEPGAIPSITAGKLGMWVFLVSEIMFFTGLIGSYIVLRLGSVEWPNPRHILNLPLLIFNTVALLTSSLTMALAVEAAQSDRMKKSADYLLVTVLLGTVFLGVKAFDYHHMWSRGFTMSTSLFGSCYYLLTAFHGLHVLGGIILLLTVYAGVRKGVYSSQNYGRIEYSGLYWHFIDVVWVILFAILCLI